MYIDAQNLYSDDQAITASAASENHINHGAARQLGVGEPLWIAVIVTVAFTDAGSDSTLQVDLQTDDNTGFGSPTTTRTLGTFAALSPIGTKIEHRIGVDDINEQFSRLNYTVAGGDFTTATVLAAIVKDIDAFTAYARGYTITNP